MPIHAQFVTGAFMSWPSREDQPVALDGGGSRVGEPL
ncbi:hypothetical protein CLBKND_01058 [Methylorubrum aminovorans]